MHSWQEPQTSGGGMSLHDGRDVPESHVDMMGKLTTPQHVQWIRGLLIVYEHASTVNNRQQSSEHVSTVSRAGHGRFCRTIAQQTERKTPATSSRLT